MDEPLQAEGPAAYFTTLPIKAMVKNVRDHGLPCHISYTAGTYVCNCVMYNVLHMAATKYPNIRAGFIHVPFASEQAVEKAVSTPSASLETIAKSLEYAIEAIAANKEDVKVAMGTTH
jgi:pyroglutamyl-peptidase